MLFDSIINGLLLGGIYALIAMGLTMQYGVARIMNLASGEVLISASFATFWLFSSWAINPIVGLIFVVPAAFVINWFIYKFFMTPLVKRAASKEVLEGETILATFGLLFIFQGVMLIGFGGDFYSFSYLATPVEIFGSNFALNRIVAFTVSAIIAVGLYLMLNRTRFGTAIRAVAFGPESAGLVGINVKVIAAFAFALGGAITAAGGGMVSMFITFNASIGVIFTMKALIIVIMGGVGDVRGAIVAGLLLGFVETFVATFIDPGLTIAATFLLFLLVLVFLPQGLFGRRVS